MQRPLLRILPLLLLAAMAVGGCGDDAGAEAPTQERPSRIVAPSEQEASRHLVGEVVHDLLLEDLAGGTFRLSEYARGGPVVIAARDVDCPLCKKMGPLLARLETRWAERGVRFLFLAVNPHDSAAHLERERAYYGLTGPILPDRDRTFARHLAVVSTTEVFLLDAGRRLRYRGAIDDRYGIGYARDEPRHRYLEDALEAVSAGREVATPSTSAPGCIVDREAVVAAPEPVAPTWFRDVAPIFQRSCQRCHRAGEPSPFYLVTYDDVIKRKETIEYVLDAGIMPPWFADHGVGGPWVDDLSLPAADKQAILTWIAGGVPQGDPVDAPPPVTWPVGWRMGEPDAVIELDPIRVSGEGLIPYQYQAIETTFEEDMWIERMEIRSRVPEAIHHVLVFEFLPHMEHFNVDTMGHIALREYFCIYSPGAEPMIYPPGRARKLPKGRKLLFQMHYTAIGRPIEDRPRLGLIFAEKPPRDVIRCNAASSIDIHIAPHQKDVKVEAKYTFTKPARIFGWTPHMHARGRAFAMELRYPDGRVEPVLRVSDWNFNWQQSYRLVEPIDVPAGTRVHAAGWFDNSAANPANPDPDQKVDFGLRTVDEMMIGYFEWVALEE